MHATVQNDLVENARAGMPPKLGKGEAEWVVKAVEEAATVMIWGLGF